MDSYPVTLLQVLFFLPDLLMSTCFERELGRVPLKTPGPAFTKLMASMASMGPGISIKEREELLRSAEYMLRQREADLEGPLGSMPCAPGVCPMSSIIFQNCSSGRK